MISQKTKITSVIAVLAIASIAAVFALSQIQSIAADTPKGNNVYVFAEGVSPHAKFDFGSVTEESDFQVFTQTSGTSGTNGRSTIPEFTLIKVPGSTPYLYNAADELIKNGDRSVVDWQFNRFNVKVDLNQAGQSVRTMEYQKCSVTSYKIYTDYDKEEAYVTGGKTGFALQDEFKFTCLGIAPINPQYLQMQKDSNTQPFYK